MEPTYFANGDSSSTRAKELVQGHPVNRVFFSPRRFVTLLFFHFQTSYFLKYSKSKFTLVIWREEEKDVEK